jgi:hypothetical protein
MADEIFWVMLKIFERDWLTDVAVTAAFLICYLLEF